MLVAFFGGPQDVAIIAVVVVLLFGGSKLPIWGKSLGEGIKQFKKATQEDDVPPPATPVAAPAPTAVAAPAEPVAAKSEEK